MNNNQIPNFEKMPVGPDETTSENEVRAGWEEVSEMANTAAEAPKNPEDLEQMSPDLALATIVKLIKFDGINGDRKLLTQYNSDDTIDNDLLSAYAGNVDKIKQFVNFIGVEISMQSMQEIKDQLLIDQLSQLKMILDLHVAELDEKKKKEEEKEKKDDEPKEEIVDDSYDDGGHSGGGGYYASSTEREDTPEDKTAAPKETKDEEEKPEEKLSEKEQKEAEIAAIAESKDGLYNEIHELVSRLPGITRVEDLLGGKSDKDFTNKWQRMELVRTAESAIEFLDKGNVAYSEAVRDWWWDRLNHIYNPQIYNSPSSLEEYLANRPNQLAA